MPRPTHATRGARATREQEGALVSMERTASEARALRMRRRAARNLVSPLRRQITLFVRLLSVLLTGAYIVFFYKVHFEWYAYSLAYFISQFFVYLIHGVLANYGLFFITMKIAKNMRFCATVFYVPTVLVSPIVASSFINSSIIVFVFFFLAIINFFYFNPWRKNDVQNPSG